MSEHMMTENQATTYNAKPKKVSIQERAIPVGDFIVVNGYRVNLDTLKQQFAEGGYQAHETPHFLLDEGPIIAQYVIHCNHRNALADLMRKGRDVERRILAEAVRLHTEDRVLDYQNKTIVF